MSRIVVGIDGSDHAHHALEWAMTLSESLGAELLVVHAAGLLTDLRDGLTEPTEEHKAELRRDFETNWCAVLERSGIPHRLFMPDGNPVLAILDIAQREAVDVIVVGRRGAGVSHELILGSTSHQLVEHSRWPVVIVTGGGAESELS